jgi:cytochrome d ubiquinol oxidase subunit I
MQTLWHRTGNEKWLPPHALLRDALPDQLRDRSSRTGLVQEFEFGMNWSVYSRFVGNVFGRAARDRGARRLHASSRPSSALDLRLEPPLARAFTSPRSGLAVLGSWLSRYFILVANSWMQEPVGYKLVDGEAQLTSVWAALCRTGSRSGSCHTILAG